MVNESAIVTGAAGAIGSAFVRSLAANGTIVVAVDNDGDRLAALRVDGEIIRVVADVSSTDGADRAVAAAGPDLRILCNIAGMGDGLASADEMTDELWDRVIAVNQTSAFRMARRSIPTMIANGGGIVLNMASVAGLRGGRAGIAYTASKWAMVGMTQNIAATLGSQGVRSYAICPSAIQGAVRLGEGEVSSAGRERSQRDAGKPAAGSPEDVVALGMFLIGDGAQHLNGVAVPVDAGWVAY